MSTTMNPRPTTVRSPVPLPSRVDVIEGPVLLAGLADGPGLAAHRERYGAPPATATRQACAELIGLLEDADLRGRGGAAFPFLVKLRTVVKTRGRAVLVANLAEGEPGSAKDHALATTRPHLVLDGLAVAARALGTKELHVIVPRERPDVVHAVRAAVVERPERFRVHLAEDRFVAGQSSAVLELMAGRDGLPVTTWVPSAERGHRGRPTLLSNAETWAHVALLALRGPAVPGTTLLTLVGSDGGHRVVEVPLGSRLAAALGPARASRPALVGGFHGRWLSPEELAETTVSPASVGAGVVYSLAPDECPGAVTTGVTRYLASQSAGRCGPCRHGLPALADALGASVDGSGDRERVELLQRQVDGRGACAHPDGTARLVRSLLATYPGCATGHRRGPCAAQEGALR